jgi:hypothetical protein
VIVISIRLLTVNWWMTGDWKTAVLLLMIVAQPRLLLYRVRVLNADGRVTSNEIVRGLHLLTGVWKMTAT